jgi:hypothetical protein
MARFAQAAQSILLDLPSQPPLEQLRAIRFQREPLETQNPHSLTQKVG